MKVKKIYSILLLINIWNASAVLEKELDNKSPVSVVQKGSSMQESLKTHLPEGDNKGLEKAYEAIKSKIISRGDVDGVTVKEQLEILEGFTKFGFGQFLIEHKGINGHWTEHMVLYPEQTTIALDPYEQWFLEKCPGVLATQERFRIFRDQLQLQVKDNTVFASIPCGTMYDLLSLNLSVTKNVRLVGIDLDQASLEEAQAKATEKGLKDVCIFEQQDAWNLGKTDAFDVITSNGLNIYEDDDQKVTALYRQFYKALKQGGVFVGSFMTPPPFKSPESPWKMSELNPEDLRRQKILFAYILEAKFQAYRTEAKTREQLKEAGFSNVEVIYDSKNLFPTFIAKK